MEYFSAVVLENPGAPLATRSLEMPDSLHTGQVLVRIHLSGVCGSQVAETVGTRGNDAYLPHLLGHEGVGEVVKIGHGVSSVQEGNRVAIHWRRGAGLDATPYTYQDNHGNQVNGGKVTTFSQFAVISENRLTPISECLSEQIGAVLGCALLTAFGCVENDTIVDTNTSVLVIGAGGVGNSIVAFASRKRPRNLCVIDRSGAREPIARSAGATDFLQADLIEVSADDLRDSYGEGFDVVFEVTGTRQGIELGYKLTNQSGHLVLVGVPRIDDPARLDTMDLHLGKRISGSNGGGTNPSSAIPLVESIVVQEPQVFEWLNFEEFPLESTNKAIAAMKTSSVGRILLAPWRLREAENG